MRKTLPLLLLLMFGTVLNLAAQTIYTQTTNKCTLVTCNNAQFTPTATLSYQFSIEYYGGSGPGTVTFNGVTYTDAEGQITWAGYGNHYPYGTWVLTGKFNGGASVLSETFVCFRSCGTGSNRAGTVVTP